MQINILFKVLCFGAISTKLTDYVFLDVATFKINLQHMTLLLALASIFRLQRKLSICEQ